MSARDRREKLKRPSQEQTGVDCPVEVVYRRIDQLKPDPRNPRRHTAKQIRQIAESIRSFGFNVPILVDTDHKVIAGHGRLLACRQLGRAEVPTIRLEHLSDAQARAFMVADNRLTEIAGWDDRLLGEQLRELADLTLDFSLEVTGFDMAEIDLLIERASVPAEPDPDDTGVPLAAGPAVTRLGDTWLLGSHRLHCGSALDETAFGELMGEDRRRRFVVMGTDFEIVDHLRPAPPCCRQALSGVV
jgi:hypothetical protein